VKPSELASKGTASLAMTPSTAGTAEVL